MKQELDVVARDVSWEGFYRRVHPIEEAEGLCAHRVHLARFCISCYHEVPEIGRKGAEWRDAGVSEADLPPRRDPNDQPDLE